ncbi:MAG: hypothetical protein AB8F74_20550 [Saprospiraceae bacterium]
MNDKDYTEQDIAKAWQQLATEKFSNSTIKKEDIMTAIKKESNTSIALLKKGLKHKLYYAVAITLGLVIVLLFSLGNTDLSILLGIGITFYVVGSILMYLKYVKIEDGIEGSTDLLQSMRYNLKTIKSVLNMERAWGVVTFIPAIIIGILYGRVSDGMTIAECFQSPRVLTTALIAIVVLIPIMTWVSGKLTKKAYGENLKILEENIIRMETLQ